MSLVLKACTAILDRTGLHPKQEVQVSTSEPTWIRGATEDQRGRLAALIAEMKASAGADDVDGGTSIH